MTRESLARVSVGCEQMRPIEWGVDLARRGSSFRRCREYLQNGIALPLSLAEYLEKLAWELGVVFALNTAMMRDRCQH